MHNAVHIDWQPIKARRASEDIYAQLRDLITSGALKPGDRLPSERAMMEQLQRSRPTIREALRMLEQGGYVASTHGASGAVVQELTIDVALSGHFVQQGAELIARPALQRLSHDVHAEQEQAQAADQRQRMKNVHTFLLDFTFF